MTAVDPGALDNLGTSLGVAADAVHAALGTSTQFTATPPAAFGPATDLVNQYTNLATQLVAHLNEASQNLRDAAQMLHDTAQRYREIDTTNGQRIGGSR